ncbi:MAG: AlpA family phage regulatory protein [Synergistaceae bacterium]|nr:AlpA family phage regulatory protein [Synergistaceae bacterium]
METKHEHKMLEILSPGRLYEVREVAAALGVKKVSIYDWMRDPEMAFPKGIKLGSARRWTAEEVNAWVTARAAATREGL